jgi:hypothetical protein
MAQDKLICLFCNFKIKQGGTCMEKALRVAYSGQICLVDGGSEIVVKVFRGLKKPPSRGERDYDQIIKDKRRLFFANDRFGLINYGFLLEEYIYEPKNDFINAFAFCSTGVYKIKEFINDRRCIQYKVARWGPLPQEYNTATFQGSKVESYFENNKQYLVLLDRDKEVVDIFGPFNQEIYLRNHYPSKKKIKEETIQTSLDEY